MKINCHTYISKFCAKYLDSWLGKVPLTTNRPTPLLTVSTWLKKFNAATGPTDPSEQAKLASAMHIKYRGGVSKLIWAMTTCRPDNAFTSVELLQLNSAPAKHHYHGLKHAIHYLYITQTDGIYFWQTRPRFDLPEGPLPPVNNNKHDLLLDDRPGHNALIAVVYGDSDWATCIKMHRSFNGICIQLAGGTIAYKTKFQPTVALPWVTRRNQPPGYAILISNILHFVIGLNVISSTSNESTPLSISPITSPNHSLEFYFTGTPITYLDISPLNTCRYINMQSQHMATQMRIMIGLFLIHLQPPLQLLQHGFMPPFKLTSKTIRGSGSYGMTRYNPKITF